MTPEPGDGGLKWKGEESEGEGVVECRTARRAVTWTAQGKPKVKDHKTWLEPDERSRAVPCSEETYSPGDPRVCRSRAPVRADAGTQTELRREDSTEKK